MIVYALSLDSLVALVSGLTTPAKFYALRPDGSGIVGTVAGSSGVLTVAYQTKDAESLAPTDLRLTGYAQVDSISLV